MKDGNNSILGTVIKMFEGDLVGRSRVVPWMMAWKKSE
jgi:hypothetical protein